MNQGTELEHMPEVEYVILSGDCVERRGVQGQIEPDHRGLEYQAKGCELYSFGSRKPLKQRMMS